MKKKQAESVASTRRPSVLAADLARTAFVTAILNLDDEGFNAIAWPIYQQSKEAGGFKDAEGWARVRAAAEKLPFIIDTQKKFDAAAAAEDAEPITVTEGDAK